MCIGDWRLGKLIRAQVTAYSVTVGNPFIVPPNQNRVGITIGFLAVSAAPIGMVSVDGVNIFGFASFASYVEHFTLATHGDLPMREWTIAATANTASGGVIEYFAPADYINAGLRAFESDYGRFLTGR